MNADILIGANGDITGYNMFAYCSDNPVVKVDSDGFFAITLTAFATFVVTAITGVCVIKVVSSPGFQKGWNKLYTTIGKTIYNGLHSLGTIIDNSIVAKKAKNAQAARDILDKVGIVYNSSHNLVSIKTGLHRRLHTTEYYALANSVIIIAYNAAGNSRVKQRSNVLCALYTIRTFILQMNEIAPF